jgi:hypothetical protein
VEEENRICGALNAGCFAGGNELLYQADVGVVDHLGVAVAVHGGQVHDGIALGNEGLQLYFILEKFILAGDALKLLGVEAQGVVQVRADKSGLAGNAYFDHDISYWNTDDTDLTDAH